MSMLGKTFLAKLSRNISIGKMVEGQPPSTHSFGGISVLMCSDFHQFPPVAVGPSEALYYPVNLQCDPTLAQLSRTIYEEFTTIVVLKEQMWVTDEVWRDFLQHLHYGRVQQSHIDMLCTLVVTNPGCLPTDFLSETWTDTSLITPRHAVRRIWNNHALQKHGQQSQSFVFQCVAEDTIKGEPLTLAEHYAVATRASNFRGSEAAQPGLARHHRNFYRDESHGHAKRPM
jgi:hypothetical protein